MTATIDQRVETLQEMIDEDFWGADEYLEMLLEQDDLDGDDKRMMVLLAWSRDNGNNDGPDDVDTAYGDNRYTCGGATYRVLLDDEADDAETAYWESYIDDAVINQIPDDLQSYFNRDQFVADMKRYEPRGRIAGYDGCENEYSAPDGEWYYIYREN
jgi:hypothetical protein